MEPIILSEKMKSLLEECQHRETNGIEPCGPLTHGFASELLIQGFIIMKAHTYKGKGRKAAYFLTDKGREFLKRTKNI